MRPIGGPPLVLVLGEGRLNVAKICCDVSGRVWKSMSHRLLDSECGNLAPIMTKFGIFWSGPDFGAFKIQPFCQKVDGV